MYPNPYSSDNKLNVNSPVSMERYISQFCKHRVELSSQLNEITHVQFLLEGTEIWPDQCDYAIQALNIMRRPVKNLFKLLTSLPSLPPEIKINRYPMIVESQLVDKQIGDLISLLDIYRSLTYPSKKQTIKEQNDINNKIGQIGERCITLVQTLDSIINQIISFNPKIC